MSNTSSTAYHLKYQGVADNGDDAPPVLTLQQHTATAPSSRKEQANQCVISHLFIRSFVPHGAVY